MFKKRFLYEEEEVELNDFQKIIAINKRKIHPSNVEFETSDGEDFSDVISIDYDGIHFKFDGLSEFLKFFFPNEYGDDSDGGYDADEYDAMYRGQWDWYDHFYNRSHDDWKEDYIVGSFKSESLKKLKEILNIFFPDIAKYIVEKKGEYTIIGETGEKQIRSILELLGVSDDIEEAYVDAQVAAVEHIVPDSIQETYCDCLIDLRIKNESERHCFWKYVMDWGSAIMLFSSFGTDKDKLLDLLIYALKKINISHLPEPYEIQYSFWDDNEFTNTYVSRMDRIFDKMLDRLEDSEIYNNKGYHNILDKILKIGGIDKWIQSKNNKIKIKINSVDPVTLKINFSVTDSGTWEAKKGLTTIDDIINILNNESLFGVEEFREHYLKFIQNTIL